MISKGQDRSEMRALSKFLVLLALFLSASYASAFTNLISIHRKSAGNPQAVRRKSAGSLQEIHRKSAGSPQEVCRKSAGSLQEIRRKSV